MRLASHKQQNQPLVQLCTVWSLSNRSPAVPKIQPKYSSFTLMNREQTETYGVLATPYGQAVIYERYFFEVLKSTIDFLHQVIVFVWSVVICERMWYTSPALKLQIESGAISKSSKRINCCVDLQVLKVIYCSYRSDSHCPTC